MDKLTRRGFLIGAGSAAIALIAGCVPAVRTNVQTTAERGVGATAAPSSGPTPAPGAKSAASAPDTIVITPTEEFYEQSYSETAEVDPAKYTLTVDGLVDTPLKLRLDDVKALPSETFMRTLECIGNPVGGPLIGNTNWKGFRISDLLSRARVQSKATHARFEAADGYFTSVELKWLSQPDTILVYEMNGEPLPPEHGFPLRILMPGLYGQKMPKWITHIEFIDHAQAGIWEEQGWSYTASVKTNSIVKYPESDNISAGPQVIYGVAFAGDREITNVEVQVDDGEWKKAQLFKGPQYVWTQWAIEWNATPGRHTLSARASDATGFTQSERASGLLSGSFPAGTDAIHSVLVSAA
jgi:DMSO/TMAO reductase YedYZ molybdopterin-dependent catalytic subunit